MLKKKEGNTADRKKQRGEFNAIITLRTRSNQKPHVGATTGRQERKKRKLVEEIFANTQLSSIVWGSTILEKKETA